MKIVPSYSEIERMAEEYNIIPVCREIYADIITPITLLRKIAGISNRYCLLESVEGDGKWSRYSFICFNPIAHLRFKNGQLTLAENGVVKKVPTLRPFKEIRAFLARYKAPRIEKIPPFAGGLVGYFSYSMIGYIESAIKLRNNEFNDFDLMMFDKVIAYDHQKQNVYCCKYAYRQKRGKLLESSF